MRFDFINLTFTIGILYLLLFVFSVGPSLAQYNAPEKENYPRVEVRPGDHCIVSGKPLGPDDVCFLVDGRRVPLKKEAVPIFLSNQEKYFSKLQPKSALFTESMGQQKALSMGWFVFGIYILVGLFFGALTSHAAVGKGLRPIPWFFGGLIFNAFGYFAVIMKKSEAVKDVPAGFAKVPLTSAPSICPECGYENHPTAKICSGCGIALNPKESSEIDML